MDNSYGEFIDIPSEALVSMSYDELNILKHAYASEHRHGYARFISEFQKHYLEVNKLFNNVL